MVQKLMRKILPVALAAAAVTSGVPAVAAVDETPLVWGPCPADVAKPGLQCGTLEVPLDYRHPDGRKIGVAVSRLASAKPAQRRGVLLVNQGGPGLAGLDFPVTLADGGLPPQVRDAYDVIGFDPRGVGHSTPVTCDMTPEQVGTSVNPPFPHTAADVTKAAEAAKTVAGQCFTSETAAMLPFVTTANTARDVDRIRAALGAPKLSYYGASYGTYLGAVYTTLYPDRSDRIVLDSSLGPDGYDVEALRSQGLGFETRFPDFAKLAAADPGRYGLGATPAAVTAKYFELTGRLDRTPAQGYDGTTFRAITAFALRSDALLPGLATLWHELDTGRPASARSGAAAPAGDNFPASYLAVVCGDSRWPQSVGTYQRNVAVDRIRYPKYGPFTANIRPCAFWPAPAEPRVRITGRGPSTVLMVQNLRDPATPLPDALRLRAAFGDRARMVTVDQGGHGVYLFAANKCGTTAVTGYFATGRRPAHDAFCPA
ncbi:alpha/beta hydrolase [Amycolatopsis sp. WQ 127309]|uniref:alpha/beta hydrolase n=1 Tax=Amycolatopsis sp. WQ 127309 TaxID=2932773 RepID=UPI001FF47BB0|nr:alpha/beta hydrolase [Amycolatopsis sp. WQ 127309]UOZ03602.1 alpha/beta hydrolase [Amycolatopsis sp. WQ 127309]